MAAAWPPEGVASWVIERLPHLEDGEAAKIRDLARRRRVHGRALMAMDAGKLAAALKLAPGDALALEEPLGALQDEHLCSSASGEVEVALAARLADGPRSYLASCLRLVRQHGLSGDAARLREMTEGAFERALAALGPRASLLQTELRYLRRGHNATPGGPPLTPAKSVSPSAPSTPPSGGLRRRRAPEGPDDTLSRPPLAPLRSPVRARLPPLSPPEEDILRRRPPKRRRAEEGARGPGWTLARELKLIDEVQESLGFPDAWTSDLPPIGWTAIHRRGGWQEEGISANQLKDRWLNYRRREALGAVREGGRRTESSAFAFSDLRDAVKGRRHG